MPPRFSVIVPVRKGQKKIEALESLKRTGNKQYTEVLVAEGSQPSVQRNQAVKSAKGEILCFLDDDSQVNDNFFSTLNAHFKNPEIFAVCGPALPPKKQGLLQESFDSALSSRFGAGDLMSKWASKGALRAAKESDVILCNFAVRANAFKKVGGFNPNLYPGEENELFQKLLSGKYKAVYDPSHAITRQRRKSVHDFIKQASNYGRGRTEGIFLNHASFRFLFFFPALFVLYLFSLSIIQNPYWNIPLSLYILLDLIFSLDAAIRKRRIAIFVPTLFIIPLMHISYGIGVFWAILKKLFPKHEKKVGAKINDVNVRKEPI